MNAYLPTSAQAAAALAVTIILVALAGAVLNRAGLKARGLALAWALAPVSISIVERVASTEPYGVRVVALCLATLYAMKSIVTQAEALRGAPPLGVGRWLAFCLAWPGMRTRAFARTEPAVHGGGPLLRRGLACAGAGLALIFLARATRCLDPTWTLPTLLLAIGLSLVLHFGLFQCIAGAGRALGFPLEPVFRNPAASRTLTEFWSRRWNVGFSEMVQTCIQHAAAKRAGRDAGVIAGFAFSGLLHEIALSVPVRAGYGLPTIYFLLQGVLVVGERRARRPMSRAWVWFWLIAPAPLVFHPAFVRGALWPLLAS
jgi:hypothetical protein